MFEDTMTRIDKHSWINAVCLYNKYHAQNTNSLSERKRKSFPHQKI